MGAYIARRLLLVIPTLLGIFGDKFRSGAICAGRAN